MCRPSAAAFPSSARRPTLARCCSKSLIKPLGLTQSALAIQLGISYPRLNEVVKGKRAVTPDTALRLARVLGMSPDFWLGLQLDWDLWHAMRGPAAERIARLEPLQPPA